ncbi:prephenate/arogenate dehydrogenase family protein [Roseospira visakhapatnamensis]|uniref:prephenate dehydrogenase n=1 Tax=Roseospira visakhapatnamensis TaxID=390880 RepID=A0A7W6RF38_9PROT|nr:prephenate/arogenate dehydrogenase family protein [Roseospira visakhapatnamensis]MBB4267370.1 cyclohexadieny/prephenate dehydrogenase [Roseospira visakhapatnamensis]
MTPLFARVAIIGIGLIGSSLARAIRTQGLAGTIACADANPDHAARAQALGVVDEAHTDPAAAARGADLVVLCMPIGAYAEVTQAIAPVLAPGAIVSDVGSVKQAAIAAIRPHLPEGVHLVPGHPIAGTEKSGPDAGFADLFPGRWFILTPLEDSDDTATRKVADLWRRCGMTVERMSPDHHDRVLAVTSHLPHLIAYTIVGTATNLEEQMRQEVVKYSASGFRDFTRIAASDPTMWRDVFLNNREAVLDSLQRFTEDLTALQRAIRWGEGDYLYQLFERTRDIRRGVVEARQA